MMIYGKHNSTDPAIDIMYGRKHNHTLVTGTDGYEMYGNFSNESGENAKDNRWGARGTQTGKI